MPTDEESDQSHQEALYDQACLILERMSGETRQRFFAHIDADAVIDGSAASTNPITAAEIISRLSQSPCDDQIKIIRAAMEGLHIGIRDFADTHIKLDQRRRRCAP